VQCAPSETHAPHASACGDGTHRLSQHSEPTAQGPFVAHVVACSQRCDVPSVVHANALQHWAAPAQSSPSPPQLAGVHRFTLLGSATHDPEQQSASVSHRSHCTEQPPMGAHRLAPSLVGKHERVQHSCDPTHASPTTLPHDFPSFAVHASAFTQRFDALHVPEQQSVPVAQISPTTRHASRSAHRPVVHTCPQHSAPPLHVSPAGWQPGVFAHVPLLQTLLQQSVA